MTQAKKPRRFLSPRETARLYAKLDEVLDVVIPAKRGRPGTGVVRYQDGWDDDKVSLYVADADSGPLGRTTVSSFRWKWYGVLEKASAPTPVPAPPPGDDLNGIRKTLDDIVQRLAAINHEVVEIHKKQRITAASIAALGNKFDQGILTYSPRVICTPKDAG